MAAAVAAQASPSRNPPVGVILPNAFRTRRTDVKKTVLVRPSKSSDPTNAKRIEILNINGRRAGLDNKGKIREIFSDEKGLFFVSNNKVFNDKTAPFLNKIYLNDRRDILASIEFLVKKGFAELEELFIVLKEFKDEDLNKKFINPQKAVKTLKYSIRTKETKLVTKKTTYKRYINDKLKKYKQIWSDLKKHDELVKELIEFIC